jgi:hypothetical protein
MRARSVLLIIPGAVLLTLVHVAGGEEAGQFAPSRLATASGHPADPDSFFEAADCGECHLDQYRDWKGSLHSRAHHDSIYLAFAELARKELGDPLYLFCSSCHAPAAVATKEIPGDDHTFLTNEGVTCDVCHQVDGVRGTAEKGGSNASIVIREGERRFGPIEDPAPNPTHESAFSELHRSSLLCSACHTLVHPSNGLVIENTYAEWKEGPYAKAGIQCQDCHMRTVKEALEVARTMKPIKVPGKTTEDGDRRENVYRHLFTGGNSNRELTGSGDLHAAEAEARLKGAAQLELKLPNGARAGTPLSLGVAVTNVAAGHAIPTSITEMRQVWIDVRVTDATGREIYRSGAVDPAGRVDPEAVMFHAVLVDEKGEVTYKPWRAVKMVKEKLIPPKETVAEGYTVPLPMDVNGPLKVKAVLRYRSAPQEVMDRLFGKGRFDLRIVDMASDLGDVVVID